MSGDSDADEVVKLRNQVADLERRLNAANALNDTVGPDRSGGEGEEEKKQEHHHAPPVLNRRSSSVVLKSGKSGYLFKWQDRSIGWGGTKWGLRFVSLDGGRLAYYKTHTDVAPRYVLTLRRCAVRDDGYKRNRKHVSKVKGAEPDVNEVGAYFHVFSIYQSLDRDDTGVVAANDDEARIVPLIRFSTPSLAEKQQWIELISDACAYCDSDDFVAAEAEEQAAARHGGGPPAHAASAAPTVPAAKPGTLPPLIFGAPPLPKPRRVPSGAKINKTSQNYRKVAKASDSAKSNSRHASAYPPSKPMHRASAPSFLSDEAPSQNYRGLLNLALIVLVVSNFRLILDTVGRHGFVLAGIRRGIDLEAFADAPLTVSPFLSGFALLQLSIVVAYLVELLLSRNVLGERVGMALHAINANCSLILPILIIWNFIHSPAVGAMLLLNATITWMKLLSYAHANSDYRTAPERDTHRATIALIRDLDVDSRDISYPRNVTLSNIYYFWFAPTLTYQIAFPRSPMIRTTKVAGIVFRLVVAVAFLLFLVAQVISPNLDSLVKDLERSGDGVFSVHIMADYLLKLSVANTYVWLLTFYIYFHLYLNLFAECLRFGDRVFYEDWWNSSNLSAYWRLWNMPVHYWLVRHVYFPCYRMGLSKTASTFMVFLVSAILHEVLISIPFHMIRSWSFIGMMAQIPLVALTKYFDRIWPGSSIGNVIFWCTFCVVGQPMAILLYTIDYWKMTSGADSSTFEETECSANISTSAASALLGAFNVQ